MGLLDNLISTAASSLLQDTDGDGQIQAIELFQQLVQQQNGVAGLLNVLQQGDLGNIVQSWVGNGANEAINPNQVQQLLGGDLQQAAANLGLDTNQASTLLAQYLPQLINGLTPNGSVADADGFGLDDIARLAMQSFLK